MAEIERLVTVWDANFQKLDEKLTKIQRSHFKAAAIIKKDADNLTKRLESRYGAAGKALDNVFNDSRLAAINAGSSRLSVFGSALEPLGAAGLAAAAGIAALAVATQQTIAAMRFADEIDDAAQKLNIGVEALQEYRFAMIQVGGTASDADSAIASFTSTLGMAQSGLSPKAMKGFAALGFTKDQLQSFSSGEAALAEVARRVSALSKESERAAVVDKLGLGPMLPLLREGAGRMEELRQKAQDLGYVMDAELVKKGAEANQQFQNMADVINVQLKSAFIGLSDEVLSFTGLIADSLRGLNDFIERFDAWKQRASDMYPGLLTAMANGDALAAGRPVIGSIISGRALRMGRAYENGQTESPDDPAFVNQSMGRRTPASAGGTRLTPPSPRGGSGRGGGRDNAERLAEQRRQREERFNDQLARIQEEIIRAQSNQLLGIDDMAWVETQELERERQASLREIVEQQAEYARSNGLRGLSDAEAEQLTLAQTELAEQKKSVREWERRRDIAAYRLQVEEDAAQIAIDLLDIDSGMARTQAERSRVEREILIATQAIARKREEARLAEDNNMSPEQRAAALASFDMVSAGRLKLFDKNELDDMRDTFRDYGREVVQAIEDGRLGEYIGDQLKQRLLDMALDGLFDMFSSRKGGGSAAGDIFSFVARAFAGGRAGGGGIAAGQWAVTGEKGPEAIRAMPGGGVQVLSNGALRGLSQGVTPGSAAGQREQMVRVVVVPADDRFNAYVDGRAGPAAARAGVQSFSAARSQVPADLARKQAYRR